MKRALGLLAALCLLTGCSGLPTAREMGDMALLRTMGVDAAEGEVEVTVSTGPRAKGLQAEGEGALILSARGDSLSAACLTMQGRSDSYVFYGYVDQLLVGEELAGAGIKPVLDYFAWDVELGLGAQLWLVREGTAREAVESGGDQGVDSRLTTLQMDGRLGEASVSRTAGEVYSDLMEQDAAFVPALVTERGEGASLSERGYGVLRGDRLAGFLEGETARGLELLVNHAPGEVLTLEVGDNRVSARATMVNTGADLAFQGEEPARIRIKCRVDMELTEFQDKVSAGQRKELSAQLEDQLAGSLEKTLACLQGWQADCAGLGLRAAALHPGAWAALREDWPAWFGGLEPEVDLQVVLHD